MCLAKQIQYRKIKAGIVLRNMYKKSLAKQINKKVKAGKVSNVDISK